MERGKSPRSSSPRSTPISAAAARSSASAALRSSSVASAPPSGALAASSADVSDASSRKIVSTVSVPTSQLNSGGTGAYENAVHSRHRFPAIDAVAPRSCRRSSGVSGRMPSPSQYVLHRESTMPT